MSISPGGPFTVDPAEPPAPDLPAPRRIPHLGHALLFVVTAALLVFGILLIALSVTGGYTRHGSEVHPKLQMASLGAAYALTFAIAWAVFPRLWNRTFLEGIRWNWFAVRIHAFRLISLGLILGLMMQVVTYFITPPKFLPIEQFFATPLDAWLMTVFGVLIAPAFEEICFRGFLMPAFAIAYDFVSLPRTAEAEIHWKTTTVLTPVALLFSAIVTSLLFAWMHAAQVAYLSPALIGLFSVSLVLTIVRVRTQSVAASAIVHAAYNSFIFIAVIIQTGGYRHLDRLTK